MSRVSKPKRIFTIMAEELNTLGGYLERGEPVPNYTPSAAGYWFTICARELRNLRGTSWEELLTPFARERFREITE